MANSNDDAKTTSAEPAAIDAGCAAILRYPIVFFLMCTSFPAGIMPFLAASSYRAWQTEHANPPKWRDARLADAWEDVVTTLAIAAGLAVVQVALVAFFRRRGDRGLLGLPGRVWLALLWLTFALGVAAGALAYYTGWP